MPELKARLKAVLRLKNIYDELIAMREQLIKDKMLNTIRNTTSIIQDTIDDNLDIIVRKLNYFQQNRQYSSENDLNIIENANTNIKNTVGNLSFLDSFVFKVYQRISSIVDRIYLIKSKSLFTPSLLERLKTSVRLAYVFPVKNYYLLGKSFA